MALARVAARVLRFPHGYGDSPVTVHVTTTSRDGSGTVVTLQGVADEDLVAMLADGIERILALDPKLFVDASALSQPRSSTGRGLLDHLLGDRTVVRDVQVVALDAGSARA